MIAMTISTGTEALRRVPLFAVLEEPLLESLAAELNHEDFPGGARIFNEGDAGSTLYVIQSGKVKVAQEEGGEESILAVLGDGDYFGELSLCDRCARSAGVVTLQPTSVYVLERETFLRFVQSHPAAAVHLLGVLATRLRQTSDRLSEMVFAPLGMRVAKRLLELWRERSPYGPSPLALTVEEIAPLAAGTAPQVEEELRALREGGIIAWDGSTLTVRSPELLEERTRGGPRFVSLGHVNVPRWLLEP